MTWDASWQSQQNDLCAQWRLWPESSQCTQWVAKDPSFLHADSEDSDQTGQMPRLIWVFAGRTCHFVGFVMGWLVYSKQYTAKDLSNGTFRSGKTVQSWRSLNCLPFLQHLVDVQYCSRVFSISLPSQWVIKLSGRIKIFYPSVIPPILMETLQWNHRYFFQWSFEWDCRGVIRIVCNLPCLTWAEMIKIL